MTLSGPDFYMFHNLDRRKFMLKKLVGLIAIIAALMGAQIAFAAVEINSADQAQLDGVAGIGPATSRAILEERKKNGNFKDWADLEQRVRGIGEKNSVKLSAAGLIVNGQSRNQGAASGLPSKPAKAEPVPVKASGAKN
jgi:competence protein ComEA